MNSFNPISLRIEIANRSERTYHEKNKKVNNRLSTISFSRTSHTNRENIMSCK